MSNRMSSLNQDRDNGIKFVLFLLSPLLSLVYSLKSLEKKSSLVFVFLFCIFWGLAFTVSNIRVEGSPDGVTYRALFEYYSSVSSNEYYDYAHEYFTFKSDIKDLYADSVAFFVSRFTSNYHIFFFFIAIVFAFFQIKSLAFLTRHNNYHSNLICLLLVFMFTFIQIKNINGLRFWTAYWIACYALFNLFLRKKKQFLVLIATLPFFHASFVVVWLLVILFFISGKFDRVWTVLLVLSLFVGNFSLVLVRETATFLPPFLSRFVDYYADEEIVSIVGSEGSGFYLLDRIFPVLVNIYLFVMLFIIRRERKSISDKNVKSLLAFTIIIITFSNFTMPIPSLGGRFMAFSYPLLAYLWLEVIGTNRYKSFIYCMPFVFLMAIYHLLQAYWQNADHLFYISSPLIDLVRFL